MSQEHAPKVNWFCGTFGEISGDKVKVALQIGQEEILAMGQAKAVFVDNKLVITIDKVDLPACYKAIDKKSPRNMAIVSL